MKRILVLAFIASAVGSQAVGFTSGNLVVSVAGDGAASLGSTGTAVFLKEFTTTGSLVNTYALPTNATGANKRFVCSGTATSELQLSRSANGKYLMLAGYDASIGLTGVKGKTSTEVNRVIARVAADGTVDTSTALTDAYSGDNFRSVASADGLGFWTTGTGSTGSNGVRYATLGSTTSTQVSSTVGNTRVANVFGGQLYVSSGSGSFLGVSSVGTGMPTTSGQTTALLPGFATQTGLSVYDFELVNSSTLFVADDRTTTLGGLQKWVLDGGTWSLATTYNLSNGGTGNYGLRSLAYDSANGVLYAVTAGATAQSVTSLVSFTEAGGFQTLATSSANTAFRGVEFAPLGEPVPEPASMVALGFGALALISRRRRNR